MSTLLSRVSAAFTTEFERRFAEAGFPDLSFSLGTNVLRFLSAEPVRMSVLVGQSGVTNQAISQQVAFLESKGYLDVVRDPSDDRAKLVRLTDRGQQSQVVARSLFREVERDWQRRFGAADMRQLRQVLEAMLDQLAGR